MRVSRRQSLYLSMSVMFGLVSAACDEDPTGPEQLVPSKLAFIVPPTAAPVEHPLHPALQVAVQDSAGRTVVNAEKPITVALASNPTGATLTGTLTRSTVDGVATFDDLSIDKPGNGYTLALFSNDVEAAISPEFSVVAAGAITQGIFWIKTCKTEKMASGYTVLYPLEGQTIYWFDGCEVVRLLDMPGRVGMVRQDSHGVYGLVGSSVIAFDADGSRRFALYRGSDLPAPAHHDVILTERGTYFTITKEPVGENAFDDVIIEFAPTTGEVVWSWSVNTGLLGEPDGARDLAGENWVHSNSLDIFPNGDILLSARNLDEIVRIKYPEGQVVWRKGSELLSLQHHAKLYADGSITVFDNGVRGKESGVVKFDADQEVVLNQRLGFYSDAFGSAEELPNGNWLVVDGKAGRVIEYTPDYSEIVFQVKLLRGNYIPYARDPSDPVHAYFYRAHRVPELP